MRACNLSGRKVGPVLRVVTADVVPPLVLDRDELTSYDKEELAAYELIGLGGVETFRGLGGSGRLVVGAGFVRALVGTEAGTVALVFSAAMIAGTRKLAGQTSPLVGLVQPVDRSFDPASKPDLHHADGR